MQKVNFFCFFSTNFLVLQYQIYIFGYKTQILVQNYSFYPKFAHFSEIFLGKNFIFRVKSTIFLVLQYQIYIFGIKTVVLYPKMYIWFRKTKKFVLFTLKMKFLPKYFTKMLQFLSKICTFWWNSLAKTSFLMQKVNFFCFFRTKCTFLGTKLQFLSKICTF